MNRFYSVKDFVGHANQVRICSKDHWVIMEGLIDEKFVSIKFFNTWIQRLEIQDCKTTYSNQMESKVSEFKEFLEKSLNEGLKK